MKRVGSLDGTLLASIDTSGLTALRVKGSSTFDFGGGTTSPTRGTLLSPTACSLAGAPRMTAVAGNDGGVAAISHRYTCSLPKHGSNSSMVITDTYVPAPHSIRISTTVTVLEPSPAFTAGLRTAISWPIAKGKSMRFWLPRTKGCVKNSGTHPGMCFSSGPWREALSPEPLPQSQEHYRFGGGGHGSKDSFSLPIATLLLDEATDAGVSLALDPSDAITELTLHASPGSLGFERELLRLGDSTRFSTRFSAHLIGHAGCYRPGLAFLVGAFPSFFVPPVGDERAADFEGLASYSSNLDRIDAARARALGFKTNWDLSGTFMPYDGLFLPYQEEWPNLGPINRGLSHYNATFDMIEARYRSYQADGFHSLSYFDIGNWGTRTTTSYRGPTRYCGRRPGGEPAPCPDPEGANSFLRDQLFPALLHHGWSVNGGRFMVHHYDWVGTTDMDTMEPIFEDLLVEQARVQPLESSDSNLPILRVLPFCI